MSSQAGDSPAESRGIGAGPTVTVIRGLVKHCGRCGAGRLYLRWFKMKPHCPGCGYRFEREEGFFLGAYVMNYAAASIVVAIDLVVLIAIETSSDSANLVPVLAIGGVAAVLVPVVFYPFSRTLWAAIDLVMRPLEPWEVAEAELFRLQAQEQSESSAPPGDVTDPH
jgi:uncharacterized protein (DUF983 family)